MLVLIGLVCAFILLTIAFNLVRPPVVRLLGALSDHSARRLAVLLGAMYVVAGVSGLVARRARHRAVRLPLWGLCAAALLITVMIVPGRDGHRPAEALAAADGNNAAFGAVLTWMALSALLVSVVIGTICSGLFAPHKVWRSALAVLLWAGTWCGVTALVIHAHARGRAGDKPPSILAYIAQVQPRGSTLFGIHQGAPGVKFTTVRHLDGCASAAHLVDPPAEVPHCRDALQLEGTGWTRAKKAEGGFSCVLFTPELGDGDDGWKARLGDATVSTQPSGGGHRSQVSYGETYDDGTVVWFTCAERRGHLPAGSIGAPLIADVVEMVTAVDLGLL